MVDYLRIGIVLNLTKPVHHCVVIGGTSPSPKLCPLQYECLPTLCHECGKPLYISQSIEAAKVPNMVTDDDATNVPKTLVDPNTTVLLVVVFEQQLGAATAPCGNTVAPTTDPKLAAANFPPATTVAIINAQKVVATNGTLGTTMTPLAIDSNVDNSPCYT
ncbi:hypothetical protein V6N13_088727 [Hibiscus sabdariffa]